MATLWSGEIGDARAETPGLVLRDPNIPRARKIALLSDWAVALADRELADREDGIARSTEQALADRRLLSAVNDALEALGADDPHRERGPIAWFARLMGA
jgi:hypothetical protein